MTCKEQERVRVIHGDCLDVLRSLPDSSVDLIATDPPYFKVKSEPWDRQWDKPAQFLAWLGTVADEWRRVLKPNGSLYCFASPQMAARVECLIGERFDVLNRITWVKSAGWHMKAEQESLRCFFPQTEAIIFAEHFGADSAAKGESGYGQKCDELRGFVFEPLRAYLDGERRAAGLDKIAINVACGFSASPGGMASRHYFSRSQWQLPTPEHYAAIRALAPSHFRREYEDLRREYEDLRRPFSVTADVPYTDVWTFPTVSHYRGKHPCEKPAALMEHIIRSSTRPGAVVLDCFAGSGATGVAAVKLGRSFVGCDMSAHWVDVARERVRQAATPEPLFAQQEAAE